MVEMETPLESNQSQGCFNWRTTGKVLGWVWITIGIIIILDSGQSSKVTRFEIFEFAFSMIIASLWLIGIAKNKSILMLISLIGSGIQAIVWLFMLVIYTIIVEAAYSYIDDSEATLILIWLFMLLAFIAVLIVMNFSLAVICYIKIKKDIQRLAVPTFKVTYASPIDMKC